MPTNYSITAYFGSNLAQLLSDKLIEVYPNFPARDFIAKIAKGCPDKSYTQRIELLASELQVHLPDDYLHALSILSSILGEENPEETGMFKNYYWVLPIAKFVELFGLDYFDSSMKAIEEITKRNTGEYAIRPFIRVYPEKTLGVMQSWANSTNFHLRRLASEGLRPKLPWSPKLDTFIENPYPVFQILELLKSDPVKFVKKSVANHLTDWLKVNPSATVPLLKKWKKLDNVHTQWILKQATRKFDVFG